MIMNEPEEVTILIIDDSDSTRRIYRRFLNGVAGPTAKLSIIEAASAKSGLDACQEHGADCILLDFRLPDQTGLELIEQLREHCQAPVVFITGQPNPLTQTQAYRLGVSSFLSKDFISSESLQTAVKEALGKK